MTECCCVQLTEGCCAVAGVAQLPECRPPDDVLLVISLCLAGEELLPQVARPIALIKHKIKSRSSGVVGSDVYHWVEAIVAVGGVCNCENPCN